MEERHPYYDEQERKAWQKYDSEMADKHPCPDYTLRTAYRNEARRLTEAAQAEKEG